jgi:hypothetical protein
VYEVICDVVPLEACGMALGSPYLYHRKTIFFREHNQYHLTKERTKYVVHAHHMKGNQSLVTMEQLKKEAYASNTPIIVPNETVDLKHESKLVLSCRSSHTLLQDEFLSCKLVEEKIHVGSFSIIFLIWLSMLMFSTWMVVGSERCQQMQIANNMCSVIMVVLQLIMMRQVHRSDLIDKGQVGRTISHLMSG